MTIQVKKQMAGNGLLHTVEKMAEVDLSACYQCLKCTAGCPAARITEAKPAEVIRRLHLGAGDELLGSDLIWMCLSCGTCSARCPMKINFTSVIDALRVLAIRKGAVSPSGNMPLFNRAFLKSVETFGRSYDLAMIMAYKLGTGSLMNDTDKFPTMLKKGKIAILPPAGAEKKTVKRIFRKARTNKEVEK
jgi:heterodisulfide reductase subunit C2